jgi:PPM family protein phosphatase
MLCSDGLTSMVADDRILELVEKHRKDLKKAAKALVDAANKGGGEDNITIVLFEIGDRVDDTLQLETAAPAPDEEDTLTEADGVPAIRLAQATETRSRRRRPALRIPWRWVALATLILLVAAAGVGVWGLSRSYFVGAQSNGHVAVYQGVPWNITSGVRLYRLRYESPLLAAELSQAERKRLFDHHLVSYGDALRSVKRYEQDIVP